jgi:hypothetical protein
LLTGAKSGVLTTVAWSSAFDSRLVAAGGTLVNLSAALMFWLALRSAKLASMLMRYFLVLHRALVVGRSYCRLRNVEAVRMMVGFALRGLGFFRTRHGPWYGRLP